MRVAGRHLAPIAALLGSGVFVSPANADDVTLSTSDPIVTSALSSLSSGDTLIIKSSSDIELENAGEAGVNIDTNNPVQNNGIIESKDVDNATGILVEHDITGGITNIGSISLIDSHTLKDLDGDGDLDADTDEDGVDDLDEGVTHTGFATGTGRYGIWIKDGVTLTGDINNGIDSTDDSEDESGAIAIQSDDSYGIRIDGVLNGNLLSPGSISVIGDNSYGVRIGDGGGGSAVTGDVSIGATSVTGENSVGVEVDDAIDGSFTVRGAISATGYHSTSRPSDQYNSDSKDGIDYYELDADDKLQSGSAVSINADIAGGIYIRGIGLEDDVDDDHDGTENESDDNLTGTITVYGGAPALSIGNNATIGLLNYDFSANTLGLDNGDDFGLYNRGSILAYGVFNDVAAKGLSVSNGATISGGILNDGTIAASSYNANSYGVIFDGGATDQIVNRNTIKAITTSNSTTPSGYTSDDVAADDTAYAIYLGAGSNVASITNTETLTAIGYDTDANTVDEANATTIYDGSNSLISITNTGSITAYLYTSDTNTKDGLTPVAGGSAIAIDTSGNSQGLTLTQSANAINEDDGEDTDGDSTDDYDKVQTPEIVGDILLGSGADTINLYAGTIDGALSFGDGADAFNIDNGAIYTGHLTDSDGQLTINVQNGRLNLTNDTADGAINITSATFGADSILSLDLASTTAESVYLNATGSVTFVSGAKLLLTPPEGLPESGSVAIITAAGGLDASSIIGNVETEGSSYLYNFTVGYASGDPNTLEANYDIKSASELGLNRNQTAAYSALLDALRLNDDASSAFASLSTKNSFFSAYEDLMPNYSSAVAELATTAIRQGQAASSNRLAERRLRGLDEVSIWAQEIGYSVDRTAPTDSGADYNGNGFGFAFGLDGPLENGDLFGLSASFITSEASEDGSRADGLIAAWFIQGNAYLGSSWGPFDLDLVGGLGVGRMKSRRVIEIGDDFSATANASWGAYEGHGSARLSAPIKLANWFVISPQAALTYVAMQEDGYTESGGGAAIDYDVDGASSQRLWADAGITLQPRFAQTGGGFIAPRLFLGYRANLIDDPAERTMRFVSGDTSFTLIDDPVGSGGPVIGLGLDSTSGPTTISISYEGEFTDQIDRHSLNAAVRFHF